MFKAVCRKFVWILFAGLMLIGLLFGTVGNLTHRSYLAELGCAVVIVVCGMVFRRAREKARCSRRIFWVMTAVCFITHLTWALWFRPVQAADYQTFFNAAVDLAAGIHPRARHYLSMFPHILGYSAFLSLFLRLFGDHVLVAAVVNVCLTCGSGMLLYFLVKTCTDERGGELAYLLWVLCPSKLLYNTMVLSEPYYTFLLLGFFSMVAVTQTKAKPVAGFGLPLVTGLLGGILLGLVNTARPIGVIPIIALVLWVLLLRTESGRKGLWAVFCLTIAAAYLLTGTLWNRYAEGQLEQKIPSLPGYNIYVGFNLESGGSYWDEDMTEFQSRYFGEFEENAVAAQESMLQSALERIREGKRELPRLMLTKLKTLLGNDEGGAYYSRESLTDRQYAILCIISNVWYYFVCMLALTGCVRYRKSGTGDDILLLTLFGVGLILAQLLVEVAARYHYALIPVLIALAASNTKVQKSAIPG